MQWRDGTWRSTVSKHIAHYGLTLAETSELLWMIWKNILARAQLLVPALYCQGPEWPLTFNMHPVFLSNFHLKETLVNKTLSLLNLNITASISSPDNMPSVVYAMSDTGSARGLYCAHT